MTEGRAATSEISAKALEDGSISIGTRAAGTTWIFFRDVAPASTIDPGDVVVFQTLDAGWGAVEQYPGFSEPSNFTPRDLSRDVAHPLAGPVAIKGAKAGMTLEIRIKTL